MSKLVLVNASDFLREDSLPGLGIGAIKAYLLQKQPKGLDIRIIRSKVLDNIEKFKPDILGISSISFNYPDAINLAKIVREDFPKITIILGGPHITALPKSLDPVFDIGVMGEGEETMAELMKIFQKKKSLREDLNCNKLKKIKGICFFDKKGNLFKTPKRELIKDVNSLPHIDRSDFDDEKYAYILSARGCPYDCPYCSTKAMWRNKSRAFTANYLMEEIRNIVSQGYFTLTLDEPFFFFMERAGQLFDLIKKNISVKIKFKISVLPVMVSNELLNLLTPIEVESIRFGAYSGSNEVLLKNKKINIELLKNALIKIKKLGKTLDIGFLINSRDENVKDFFETYKFINDLNIKDFRLSAHFLNPGSEYWKWAKKNRIIKENGFNYRLLDYQRNINEINELNFINLSKESVSNLIKWGKDISLQNQGNNLYDIIVRRIKLTFIRPLFIKMRRLDWDKIVSKLNNLWYFLHFKNKRNFPKSILINVNSLCNLNCDFCINKITRLSKIPKQDFLVKDAIKILPEVVRHKPYICISGGEPLLNKDIFEVIQIFRKNGIKRIELITNGYLLKKYFREIILSGLSILTVSLDHYLPEIHDHIRGVKGASANLSEGLKLLSDYKKNDKGRLRLNINTVVNKYNYKDLSSIYDYVEKFGNIDTWYLRHLTYTDAENYERQVIQKNNRKFPVDNINGALYKSNYFEIEEITLLENQLKQIKRKSVFYKTKLEISPAIVNLKKYYSGFNFSETNICRDVFESVQIINGKILTRCSYVLGSLDSGIEKAWNGKNNSTFLTYLKQNGLPQCWRCTRRNYD